MNYTGVADVGTPFKVTNLQECAEKCANDTGCLNWLLTKSVNVTGEYTCAFKGNNTGITAVANTDATVMTFWGPMACSKGMDLPALPEEAVELGYVEKCHGNQVRKRNKGCMTALMTNSFNYAAPS